MRWPAAASPRALADPGRAALSTAAQHTHCGSPGFKRRMLESTPDMALKGGQHDSTATAAEQPPTTLTSPRKSRKSPLKTRKRPASVDLDPQPNSENYSYGDPRVEPLSQLSDIVTMDEPADPRCKGGLQPAALPGLR